MRGTRILVGLMCVVLLTSLMVACGENKEQAEKLAYDRETAAMAVQQAKDAGLKVEETPTAPAPEEKPKEEAKPEEVKPEEAKPETQEKGKSWAFWGWNILGMSLWEWAILIVLAGLAVFVLVRTTDWFIARSAKREAAEREAAEEAARREEQPEAEQGEEFPGAERPEEQAEELPGEETDERTEELPQEEEPQDEQAEERPDDREDQAGRTLVGLLLVLFLGFVLAFVTAPLFAGATEDRLDSQSTALRANTQMIGYLKTQVEKVVPEAKAAAAAESKKALDGVAVVKQQYIKEGGPEQRWMLKFNYQLAVAAARGVDLDSIAGLKELLGEYKGTVAEQQKIDELLVAAIATKATPTPTTAEQMVTSAPTEFKSTEVVVLSEETLAILNERYAAKTKDGKELFYGEPEGYVKEDSKNPFVREADLSGYLKQNENNPFIQADTLAGFKAIMEAKGSTGLQDLVRLGVLTSEDLVLLDEAKKAEREGNPMPAEVRQASIVGRVAKVEGTIGSVVDSASRANTTAGQALGVAKAAHKEVAPKAKDRGAWAAYALRLHRAGLTLAEAGFKFGEVRKDHEQPLSEFRKELSEELKGMNVAPNKAEEIAKAVTVGLSD